jgi:hypothetical protein
MPTNFSRSLIDFLGGFPFDMYFYNEEEKEDKGEETMQVIDLKIKKVIFNNPATIVYWEDGTKTVVKVAEGDVFDEEAGVAMAHMRKIYGNRKNFKHKLKAWTNK